MYYEENYQWNIDITTMDAVSVFYMTSDGTGFPSHSHSFYEIRYNRNWQHEITLNDQHIFLPKGSLTFISPLTIHSFCKELLPADLLQIQFLPKILGVSHLAKMIPVISPSGDLAKNGYLPVPEGSPLQEILNSMISYVPRIGLAERSPTSCT